MKNKMHTDKDNSVDSVHIYITVVDLALFIVGLNYFSFFFVKEPKMIFEEKEEQSKIDI